MLECKKIIIITIIIIGLGEIIAAKIGDICWRGRPIWLVSNTTRSVAGCSDFTVVQLFSLLFLVFVRTLELRMYKRKRCIMTQYVRRLRHKKIFPKL